MDASMDVVTTAVMANHAHATQVGGMNCVKFLALIQRMDPVREWNTAWSRASMVNVQMTLTSANVLSLT